jgi:hypothetical protein
MERRRNNNYMGLITKEVEIGLGIRNIQYYRNKGYEIPKNLNSKNIKGTSIKLKNDKERRISDF